MGIRQREDDAAGGVENLTVTVVSDNNPGKEGLCTPWGFSALVTGAEESILFDTEGGQSLLANMEKLRIEPGSVDVVFLSHHHADHTGGTRLFLERNPDATVYLLESFPAKLKDDIRAGATKTVEVRKPVQICRNVYSTGRLGTILPEQSLVVGTGAGLVVIVGCSHPGILKVLSAAKNLGRADILLVMGGFHLEWTTKGRIERIIGGFRRLGVKYVAPAHCTGEKATSMFARHFGANCLAVGAGTSVSQADLR